MMPRSAPRFFVLALIAAAFRPFPVAAQDARDPAGAQAPGLQRAGAVDSTADDPASTVPPTLVILEPWWDGIDGETEGLKALWEQGLREFGAELAGTYEIRPMPALSGDDAPSPLIRATITGEPGGYSALFQLEDRESGAEAMKYLPFDDLREGLYLEFARALESLARAAGTPPPPGRPVLVDSFSPSDLRGVDLPAGGAAAVVPWAIAARPDGNLLVALGDGVLEFGPLWQVVDRPARALAAEGGRGFAYGMALTPSGTLYLRPLAGDSLWIFPEGSGAYRRRRIDAPQGSAFGVLDDGSPFSISPSPPVLRVYGDAGTVEVAMPRSSVVFAAAPGPEGTLWIADTATSAIRVLSGDGKILREAIYPDLPQGYSIMRLRPLEDGGFLLVTNADFRRYDRRGTLLWAWDGREEGFALTLSIYNDIVETGKGVYCVSDYLGRRIIRIAESRSSLGDALSWITPELSDAAAGKGGARQLLALAEGYEERGGIEAARAVLERYLDSRPGDGSAAARAVDLEARLLSAKAAVGEAEVAELLERYGSETARETYGRTVKTLEALKALRPGDAEVAARLAAIKRSFRDAEYGTAAAAPRPALSEPRLGPLFPSLFQVYRTRSAGSIAIKNTLKVPLEELRAELFVPKYMDYPFETPSAQRLEVGAEARLDLYAFLNEKVLEVEEDLPLLAKVSVKYRAAGVPSEVQMTVPFTLLRRSALSWDDTGRLASFVTPFDGAVESFAFAALAEGRREGLPSENLVRAAAICSALGSLPLRYVPDPASPLEEVFRGSGAVDTVRFPRTTLAYRGGDCDDTSALLAALLEAAGVPTAIVTSPGHVFVALDAGLPPRDAWILGSASTLANLAIGNTLWIPLESTTLEGGLAGAWKAASALVARYRNDADFSLTPLAELRARYPALPLPPSALPSPRPDGAATAAVTASSAAALDAALFATLEAAQEARYQAELRERGAGAAAAGNRLARVQAAYGRRDRAAATLEGLVARYPDYLPAYLNLAVFSARSGDRDGAAAWLARAECAAPASPRIGEYAALLGLRAGTVISGNGEGAEGIAGGNAGSGDGPQVGVSEAPGTGVRAEDLGAAFPWIE